MSVIKFDPIVTQVLEAANYTHALHPNKIGTLHDIECPGGKGWVVALLGPSYMGNSAEQASVQLMVDAADVGQGTTLGMQAWHVGGPGNQLSDGIEQAGYASFSRAMFLGTERIGATYVRPNGVVVSWTQQNNVDMAAQLELVAQVMARMKKYKGIELRWLSLDELRQAKADYEAGRPATISGWCRHMDWTDSGASSTTHQDPSRRYPTDVVMAKAIRYYNGTPTPTPTPTPTKDWFDMATREDLLAALEKNNQALADLTANKVLRALDRDPGDLQHSILQGGNDDDHHINVSEDGRPWAGE
jgi:hypothetical protein